MRWEYMYLELPHNRTTPGKVANEHAHRFSQIEAILNELGAEGWEVVESTHTVTGAGMHFPPRFLLKRPIDPSSVPAPAPEYRPRWPDEKS